jgi:hypothetical protein
MASGVDDDATLRANREIFKRVRCGRGVRDDATLVDTRVDLFGTTYNSPIFLLCPTGGERSFFTDGELSVARAAKAHGYAAVPVDDDVDGDRGASTRRLAGRSGISCMRPASGRRASNCSAASKPRARPSCCGPSTTRRAATARPTGGVDPKISAAASRATDRVNRRDRSAIARCSRAST